MLLLAAFLLVAASAVMLVLGFVRDALGYIYVSMVCAGVAGLALIVFVRLARRRMPVPARARLADQPSLPPVIDGRPEPEEEPVARGGGGEDAEQARPDRESP
ncbi:MAG: hypothetical protein JO337_03050 [Acidimicrobiales bacterium]|nr:hypothetical protein [Acidimicrobiales bacterium]